MAKQKKTEEIKQILIRKYYDVVGRIVSVFKNPKTREYTIEARLYDRQGRAISLLSLSFPNRKACMKELQRYPREKREHLNK